MKIDLKDRKILYQLDFNCRQSNTQIGKKVGLSRKVVEYRIKRMEEEGIIQFYWTAVDTYKLGYQVFRIYINFRDVTKEIKNKIINHFVDYKDTWAVISVKIPFDLDIVLWVNDINKFYRFWNETLNIYDIYFAEKKLSNLIQVVAYQELYLLKELGKAPNRKPFYDVGIGGKTIEIDEIDNQILNILADNARTPTIKIANKLRSSSQMISHRIDKLLKNGIIKAFRVYLDYSKIDLNFYAVDIHLKDHTKRSKIIEYVCKKPSIEYYLTDIGWSDICFQIAVENMEKLMEFIDDINLKFPDSVRKADFWIMEKFHKERWLPRIDFKFR